jgi:hypothetical protein
MKKLVLLSLLVIIANTSFAQGTETDRLYHAYRGADGVVSIFIPGFLCRFAAAIGDMDPEEEELLRTIKSIRILSIENSHLNNKVNFVEEIKPNRMDKKYKTLLEVHEKNEDVIIYAREKNESIRELTIIVGGDENTLVCIKGRLNRDLLHVLSEVTGITECSHTKKL